MNYLAHLYFGRKSDASLVGNLMGDFAKGNEESLREIYPDAVVEGILMHRKIDKFTDEHRFFKESRILLSSRLVKYAGIVVDLFFDHFLAKHWDRYGEGELETFVESCHKTLLAHPDWHSPELKERLPKIIENQVLLSYRDKQGVKIALERIANRSQHAKDLPEAYTDFERNYEEFEKIFHEFFPVVKNYAATLAPSAELHDEEPTELSDEELITLWRQHAIMMADKGFRIESLIGLYTSKGVSQEAAQESAKQVLAMSEAQQNKFRRALFIPGIACFIIAPLACCCHWFIPIEVVQESPLRNFFAGMMLVVAGYLLINRSSAVR